MKVTKQIPKAVKDGTPFPIESNLTDGSRLFKLAANDQEALYSISDQGTEKLKGYAIMNLKGQIKKFDSIAQIDISKYKPVENQ